MKTTWLGTGIDYRWALNFQVDLLDQRLRGEVPDQLLLLEHAPVYTIGRTRDQSSLGERGRLPHPCVQINRGGQATYHGPGQLTGYLICDLRERGRDLHHFLRSIEQALLQTCELFKVHAQTREGLTGIWVNEKKLASIGVGVRKWISMHGFAINITQNALCGFESITPCGLSGVAMTSMHCAGAPPSLTSRQFGHRFSQNFFSAPKC